MKGLLLLLLLTLISCDGRQRRQHEKDYSRRPLFSWRSQPQPKIYHGNPIGQIGHETHINKGSYRQMPKLGPIGRIAWRFAQRFPKIVENTNLLLGEFMNGFINSKSGRNEQSGSYEEAVYLLCIMPFAC